MSPADLPVPSTLLEFHMSHALDIDPRRTYVPRHGKPEQLPEPVTPPAWATDERARPIRVPCEETALIDYPSQSASQMVRVPLLSRAPGHALEAETRYPSQQQRKARRLARVLGPALHALGIRGHQ